MQCLSQLLGTECSVSHSCWGLNALVSHLLRLNEVSLICWELNAVSHIGWGTERSVSQLLGTECSVSCWGRTDCSACRLLGTECSVSHSCLGLTAVSLTVVWD